MLCHFMTKSNIGNTSVLLWFSCVLLRDLFFKAYLVLLQIDVIEYNLVHCTINSLYIQHGSVTLSFGHEVNTQIQC